MTEIEARLHAQVEEQARAIARKNKALNEIANTVPTCTQMGNMRVCDVEQVFILKRIAREAAQ